MALRGVAGAGVPAKQRRPSKQGWQKQLSVTRLGETPNQKTESIEQQQSLCSFRAQRVTLQKDL